ncbi:methylated-DNA--[protein]-cysteine S-methyltransferase [Kitasatospora sp. GAS204B]|uniref:methylated-DNA--[protein]-cysteine S-methyltransferase n=1 Tax=unclassified Kitasatospora TaxID=2633591 RepID=UPI0024747051|nr:methylated-DNA--[protein]-cysteine S-methyltransferase [Kitasatospora sp. GAS204B]MDH6119261.1 methylated-DNA-[protein]-cysteine S-methyltransferase [Kitasatospora sp. GAS204B]
MTSDATSTVSSTVHATIDSPLGELLLVGEESASAPGGITLRSLSVSGQRRAVTVEPGWRADPAAFTEIVAQLRAYFAGDLKEFAVELHAEGTEFQRRVWQAIDTIPYGTTTTYGRLAEQIGAPRSAVRAVGTAIGANPLLIIRPCHRIIGANGSLTGYAAGLERKEYLLAHEGALPSTLV